MTSAEVTSSQKNKALSYLVVGINTIEESRRIFKFLRLNGYKDVSLFSNFPEIKGTELPITTHNPEPGTHPFARVLGYPSPLGKIPYRNSNDELLAERESSSRTSDDEPRGTGFCCVLCGSIRPLLDARNSPKKLEQNIIFLSCLLMENAIDMETAVKLYKETFVTFRRLCQKHFIRAAAFIGREIKEMSGRFPVYGLHNVPKNILEVFLGHLQVFGDCLDEKVVLETYDIIRFFNDCLARYHSADEWGVAEMKTKANNSRKRKELSPSRDVPGKVKPRKESYMVTENVMPIPDRSQSPLYAEAKQEPVDYEGISAADLLDQAAQSPCSSMSFDSSSSLFKGSAFAANGEESDSRSVKSNSEERRSCQPQQGDGATSTTCSMRIIRNRSNCLDTLADVQFRERFRMSRRTFKVLCDALDPLLEPRWQHTTKSSTAIRVGTALEIMAGHTSVMDEANTLGASVSDIFSDVLDALLEWSGKVIYWPGEAERERISRSFFEVTGVSGIVGCLDGTIIELQNSVESSNSKGNHALNVSVVTDDEMKFRWVFAKYRSDVDDNTVFKRSLLCEQLREGSKKGTLIGDDAYVSEKFLLTPNMENTDPSLTDKLRNAHYTVQETIACWKRQFPILTSDIRSAKVARIIVGSAALYNLTRAEGEPIFAEDEEEYQRLAKDMHELLGES